MMWINGNVAGARELLARWAGPLLDVQPPKVQRRPTAAPPVGILGVPFEPVTFQSTLRRIDQMIDSGKPHYIATANVDFLIQARKDLELRHILLQADLVLCDGTPLLWISRLFGNSLPERVAGSDLTPLLIERAAANGYRIFFLGGQPEVAAEACARLTSQFPDLIIAGHYSPPFKPLHEMDHEDISRRIRAAKPDILFVSFGCPKAEKWMAMHYRSLGVPLMIGVGATIDFLAGRVKRAPGWMQRSGTEWLYRLALEPRRLYRRYARDFAELCLGVVGQWWHFKSGSSKNNLASTTSIVADDPAWLRLRLPERLDKAAVIRDDRIWAQVQGQDCLAQMQRVELIDSTGLALLARLHYKLRAEGNYLVLVSPSPRLRRSLQWSGFEALVLIADDIDHARHLLREVRDQEASPVVESAVDWTLPLTWQGEITAASADEVWQKTHEYLSLCSTRKKEIAIDLSKLRFLDSAAIHVMLKARRYARQLGVQLAFLGVRPGVRELIRVSGLHNQLLD